MTAVACQAKSQKNKKSCFSNLFRCCCSSGSQKKPEVETVEIYQRCKNPFESNLSLLTQCSCEEHAFLKPKTFSSTTSQTDRSYPVVSSGDQADMTPHFHGDAIVNYCQTIGSNTEPKSNIKLVECVSLTDEMIRKDNQELVETILAKYLEYKHQESLIKQQIREQMQPTATVAYCHHEEQESPLQNYHVVIDSNDPDPCHASEFKEKTNAASSSDSVELPVKSKSEPAHCEHCMLHSQALSLNEVSKSDSYIMLTDEAENNKLELVFLPSSSTEICAGEAVNQLESSKSIQYKISCSDHEQSYTVGCMNENGNIISNNCDGKESKATTKSDDGDFQHLGTPSVVKWKLSTSSHPDDLQSDS